MAIKYLIAEQRPEHFYFRVWIDTTKTLPDGSTPDPMFIKDYAAGLTPAGQDETTYLNEIKSNIEADAAYLAPLIGSNPTPLSGF